MALEITLAGEVTIRTGAGQPLALRSARARVAFAMLVLERDRGVTRDLLAEVVWPHNLPRTWDSALRTVVSEVRGFVAQALPPGDDPLPALTRRYQLRLPDDLVVDVEQAEATLTAAQDALTTGDHPQALQLADEAAGVLRGPFLPDQQADWVTAQQDRLGRTLVAALETSSQAAAAQGDGATALAAADEAITRAPLRESAHRCRMAAHVAAGNRAEALRAYQHLRRVLADELGTDPAPETEAAYLALLGAAPAGAAAGPRPDQPPAWSSQATPTTAVTSMPLVGRDVELDRLGQAWDAATSSTACQVVLVTGDTGIGKTRLAVEAAHRASSQGGLVLLGRCERDAVLPYQPFVELLDAFVATIPDDELPRLDREARAELAAVFPSFAAAAATASPPDHSPRPHRPVSGTAALTGDRARLFDAVADLLVAATADRPVAVVLDDLQWASTDTQLLLRHLLARATAAPLLVVAVAREPAQFAPPLVDALRSVERDARLYRVALDGLTEAGVRTLVEQVLPGSDHEAGHLARRLLAETSGNPFMLTELLRSYRDVGAQAGTSTPPAVQDLVSDMLASVDRPTTDLLRTAAVSGTTFELDLVAAAADLDELAALDALDTALEARLVREVPALVTEMHPPRFRFAHEIVQRTVYGQLTTPRRRLLHARLADAVEAHRSDDLAQLDQYVPVLARHRSAAAGPAGDHRAVLWSRAAGAQANRHRAAVEALRLYQQALQHVPADDVALRAEVLGELGMTQVAAGDPAGEGSLLEASLQARSCGRLDVAAWTCLCVADLAHRSPGLRATAASLVDDVLRDLGDVQATDDHPAAPPGDAGPRSVDRLVHARLVAQQVHLRADTTVAATATAPPAPPATAGRAATTALEVLRDHLLTVGGPDQLDERQDLTDDLAALADSSGDQLHADIAAHHQATLQAITGGGPTHATTLPHGPGTEALRAEHDVAVAVTQGRFQEALATTRQLASRPPESGAGPAILDRTITPPPGAVAARQLVVRAWLQRALGVAAPAAGANGDALVHPAGDDPTPWASDPALDELPHDDQLPCTAEQALLTLAGGDAGAARLTVQALIAGTATLPPGDRWLHAAGLLALTVTELHDAALAVATYDLLAPYTGFACGVGYRSFVGTVTFHLGRLAAVAGDHAEAERHLTVALQQHSDANARPWIALTQQALADVLEARGRAYDRDSIAALRTESQAIVRTLANPSPAR